MAKVMISFNHQELNRLGFSVMVEMWDKLNNRKRKEYNKQFTEQERETIRRYYKIFYAWYLITGTPSQHVMAMNTYDLLNRAIGFFASL